ncbi:hypothetical protein [Hwanghaeella sp.]|uniref:hypothetical protein n=1 Tax=Hwanghaeella sp. TaxID=2605943 RepID=UPI003CCC2CDF
MSFLNSRVESASETACFSVVGVADPNLLHRLLEPFAKRGLIPSRVHADSDPQDRLLVDIQVGDMDQGLAARIGAGLRQVIGVELVLVSSKAHCN